MYKIAISAICKNETLNIESWYDSIKEADYICVLDVGSTDDSYEKLKSLPITASQKVFTSFSFGAARTACWKLIPQDTDYVFILDLDERINDNWRILLEENLKEGSFTKGLIERIEFSKDISLITRIFPYNKNYSWKFPVSEELFNNNTPLFSRAIGNSKILKNIYLKHLNAKKREFSRTNLQIERLSEARKMIEDPTIEIFDRILISESAISTFETVRNGELNLEDYSPFINLLENQEVFKEGEENYSYIQNLINYYYLLKGDKENKDLLINFNKIVDSPIEDLLFYKEFLKIFIKNSKELSLKFFKGLMLKFERKGINTKEEARFFREIFDLINPYLSYLDRFSLRFIIQSLNKSPFKPFKYTIYMKKVNNL